MAEKQDLSSQLASATRDIEAQRAREAELNEKVHLKRTKAQQMKQIVHSTKAESAAVKEQMTSVSGELQRKIGESLKEAMIKAKEVEGL